jgi:hypothetical protein
MRNVNVAVVLTLIELELGFIACRAVDFLMGDNLLPSPPVTRTMIRL